MHHSEVTVATTSPSVVVARQHYQPGSLIRSNSPHRSLTQFPSIPGFLPCSPSLSPRPFPPSTASWLPGYTPSSPQPLAFAAFLLQRPFCRILEGRLPTNQLVVRYGPPGFTRGAVPLAQTGQLLHPFWLLRNPKCTAQTLKTTIPS